MKQIVAILSTFLVVGVLGYAFWQSSQTQSSEPVATEAHCMLVPDKDDGSKMLAPLSKAPDFEMTAIDGKVYKLSDYKGKQPVFLELFATWCPHCQHSVPGLKKLYAQFGDKVQFFSINAGDDPEKPSTAEEFHKKYEIAWPLLDIPRPETLKNYCLTTFPSFYLIDKEGKVVFAQTGTLEEKTAEKPKKEGAKPVETENKSYKEWVEKLKWVANQ